jgi:flavin reductase (DIM6/NTAB) family NADH-FMN oxidoreductase RutF
MSSFEQIEILNNFYQTSSFFPMPTLLISTLTEDGTTNLGAYSLCFPYYIAEKEYFAMFLAARNSSNTAQNILRDKYCALNFISHKRRYMKETVRLGFPGEATDTKMGNTIFTLEKGKRAEEDLSQTYPMIVKESEQVFECTWDNAKVVPCSGDGSAYDPPYNKNNGITSEHGAIFILKIEKILMKSRWKRAIVEGNGRMPSLPVDYGFRDNKNFWISRSRRPVKFPIPKDKGVGIEVVQAAALKLDPTFKWEEGCYETLKLVPKVFLNTVLKGIYSEAEEQGTKEITKKMLAELRDKRKKEKKYH